VLAGVHFDCIVLFGRERVRGTTGLRGKAVGTAGGGPYLLLSLMVAEVGLEPRKDIRWIVNPAAKPRDLFIDGKIDAIISFSAGRANGGFATGFVSAPKRIDEGTGREFDESPAAVSVYTAIRVGRRASAADACRASDHSIGTAPRRTARFGNQKSWSGTPQ
jgi:hypothetical protein